MASTATSTYNSQVPAAAQKSAATSAAAKANSAAAAKAAAAKQAAEAAAAAKAKAAAEEKAKAAAALAKTQALVQKVAAQQAAAAKAQAAQNKAAAAARDRAKLQALATKKANATAAAKAATTAAAQAKKDKAAAALKEKQRQDAINADPNTYIGDDPDWIVQNADETGAYNTANADDTFNLTQAQQDADAKVKDIATRRAQSQKDLTDSYGARGIVSSGLYSDAQTKDENAAQADTATVTSALTNLKNKTTANRAARDTQHIESQAALKRAAMARHAAQYATVS